MSLFTIPLALIGMLLGGIPAHLLLLRLGYSSLIGYAFASLAIVVIVHFVQISPSQPFPDFSDFGLYAPYALSVSLVAWYIAARE